MKKVKVTKEVILFLLVSSLFVAIFISFCSYQAFRIVKNKEIEIYADSYNLNMAKVEIEEERTIPVYVEKEVEKVINPVTYKNIGEYRLTAYCPCSICCDNWGASPEGKGGATGVGVYEGITFAVDPSKIPYGTKLYIEGVGVGIATDCGGAIKGNRIDVYFRNHQDALNFGTGGGVGHTVYIIKE